MKLLFTLFTFLDLGYQFLIYRVACSQRKKPLPEEVADIYDANRYQTFLNYKNDSAKFSLTTKSISSLIDLLVIYCGFFSFIESLFKNQPYFIVIFTALSLLVINSILGYFFDYYNTFVIQEKYGKNKKDLKEFHKDFFLDLALEIPLTLVIYLFTTFVCETLGNYSNMHSITYKESFYICSIIVLIFLLILIFFSFMSYFSLKKQYQFVEMENNNLRVKIEAMMDGCKKKVKHIQIYNESKKSTSKNAFLLKFLWIKEFGIADNFINENSEKELLAVLAHEIGHLKHKKDIYDLMKYMTTILLFLFFVWIITNNSYIKAFNTFMLREFNLTYNNYFLSFMLLSTFISPLMVGDTILINTITRIHEYEADRNSVKMGYGKELIDTFKQLSNDELVDVNPAPFIEITSYNHPGMVNRIKAIKKEMKKLHVNN